MLNTVQKSQEGKFKVKDDVEVCVMFAIMVRSTYCCLGLGIWTMDAKVYRFLFVTDTKSFPIIIGLKNFKYFKDKHARLLKTIFLL